MTASKRFFLQSMKARDGKDKGAATAAAKRLLDSAALHPQEVMRMNETSLSGLSEREAASRFERYGANEISTRQKRGVVSKFFMNFRDPVTALLLLLAAISFLTGDLRAGMLILLMIVLSVGLRFAQELTADAAAEKLRAMVRTTAVAVRDGKEKEIPLKDLVQGDVIRLAAGDLVPADVRLVESKDLHVNQSMLTGESFPVPKYVDSPERHRNPLELPNTCFLGTNVESGSATAIVLMTGSNTYFGSMASSMLGERDETSFDKGTRDFTRMILAFIAVMVPLVFLINGFSRHNWFEAFFFALAVAVGLTPDMLPMILTVNLAKGAASMSKKKVIVKKLDSIQNFGAMDVLCTDKTGTITVGRVILERHVDVRGGESEKVLDYAYLNSFHQTGLRNIMDAAILAHKERGERLDIGRNYRKLDELPFDFVRKRMSVVLEDVERRPILVCKGAVEEVLSLSARFEYAGQMFTMNEARKGELLALTRKLNSDGFRVLALAYRRFPSHRDAGVGGERYGVGDESALTLLGFLAFLDPPKDSATEAIAALKRHGVQVKILTGDNEFVTGKICRDVGLEAGQVVLGGEVDGMSDAQLSRAVERTNLFAKLSPMQKARIIRALRQRGRVVGYMGDGINDAPALRAADIGISVDTAVDIAKESSDIILLEKNLLVLDKGVIEGRKVFGNIVKYLKMAISSSFGNMFSVVGGSLFLPFLPMEPVQILTNNILYEFSQTPIPTDKVDEEYLMKPRKWKINEIQKFVLFIGPVSSVFDYATYFMMLFVFKCWNNPALFHTGWFVESLLTQTLIIHIIRTDKLPFIQSRASVWLTLGSLFVAAVGVFLPYSPLGSVLGFVPLPPLYWLLLVLILISYAALTQLVKSWFVARYEAA